MLVPKEPNLHRKNRLLAALPVAVGASNKKAFDLQTGSFPTRIMCN